MHHDLTPEQQALSEIIIHAKYARFLPEHRRREGWDEIIERNRSMHLRYYSARVEPDKWDGLAGEIEHAYRNFVAPKKVLPSMRSLQFAGRAMELSHVRGNNCAFLPVDDPAALREVMFLLLSGAGAGFSVQHHHTARLPAIRPPSKRYRYKVSDNIEGWADAVDVLMQAYFGRGEYLPVFDYRDVRAKGSYLVTSGGRAPGPEPLAQALRRIQALLDSKHPGAKLRPIDVHDILCHIGDAVYAGGIRRAAMISLFDAEDELMLAAKSSSAPARLVATLNPNPDADGKVAVRVFVEGAERDLRITEYDLARLQTDGVLGWWAFAPQRARANNSAVLVRNGHTREDFARVFAHTRDSGSGEPGFVWLGNTSWGLNPCCEVSLEPFGLCNLVEINASTITSQQDLNERAAAAALIATLQAGYTDFHYLRPIWRETAERAALIGVGATGIASGNFTRFDLAEAAEVVRTTNERIARVLGINPAHRMTTVKPAGSTSLVLGTSSGIHAWHAPYYIRRMRVNKGEALYEYLKQHHQAFIEDDIFDPGSVVFSVPQKAPAGAVTRGESALELLERVSDVYRRWIVPGHAQGANTNNVSCTVSVREDEWDEVEEWMWEHRREYTGLSLMPANGGSYRQAPFEDISEERYLEMVRDFALVDTRQVVENEDMTDLVNEIACGGGACELTHA